jgi:hypothetical protein
VGPEADEGSLGPSASPCLVEGFEFAGCHRQVRLAT